MRETRKHLHQVPCCMGGGNAKRLPASQRMFFSSVPKSATLPNRKETTNTVPISAKCLIKDANGVRDQDKQRRAVDTGQQGPHHCWGDK